MNDLERDLRTLLDGKASAAGVPEPDARLLRRARRRQMGTVLAGALGVAVILGGVVVAVWAFGPSRGAAPADPLEPRVQTTVNGVTVTHPESWTVLDPVEAGIAPETETTTRLIVLMSNAEEITPEAISCPGRSSDAGGGLVMTIQEVPLALAGEGARPWPVELVSLIEPSQDEVGPSGCHPGWTFLRGSWTANGRGFEARVGFGPDASDDERDALEAAFGSLRFAPQEGPAGASVIATGTAGGEDWELIAEVSEGFFVLRLEYEGGGISMPFSDEPPIPEGPEFSVWRIGTGEEREVVVVGAATSPITRIEAVPVEGPPVSTGVVDVPDEIGGNRDAFILAYRSSAFPDPGAAIIAYDAAGDVVATETLAPEAPISLGEGVEVAWGDDWTLWINDGSGFQFELTAVQAPDSLGQPAGELGNLGAWDAEIGSGDVFVLSGGRAVAYGFVLTAAERVSIELEDGSTVQTDTIAPPSGFAYELKAFAVEIDGERGDGRISLLDRAGREIGSARLSWAPGRGNDFRFEPPLER